MLKIYNTDLETNKFEELKELKRGVWINMVNPSDSEIKRICKETGVEEDFLRYPLDYDEQARIDIEDNSILFIIDVPIIEETKEGKAHTTMPLGIIFVGDDYFITVSLKKNNIIDAFERGKIKSLYTYKKTRFLLQILYLNSAQYLETLKKINKEAEATTAILKKSMRNKELIQLLNIENSLIYVTTSLKSNELVMEKTLRGKIIKMDEEDEDILEDAIIENKQAIEMSKTYSDILNSTMDAYASIISNNLNVVMKFLASVTVIISLPTFIASIWGMNVPLPFQHTQYGFVIVIAISAIISAIAYILFKKKDML